jgi:hypothetical protein
LIAVSTPRVRAASYLQMEHANLHHIPTPELLDAMRESLRKLDNLNLLSPDDLAMLPLKRNIEDQISKLERQSMEVASDPFTVGSLSSRVNLRKI